MLFFFDTVQIVPLKSVTFVDLLSRPEEGIGDYLIVKFVVGGIKEGNQPDVGSVAVRDA